MDKTFRGFMDVIHELNRGRQMLYGGGGPTGADNQERTHVTAWAPTTDVFVKGGDLVIRVELAGVKQEDIEVTLMSGTLTISGKRESGFEEDEVGFYVRERFFGAFRRTMNLPEGIDEDRIEANFEDGVLEIVVSGAGVARQEPKQIQVGGIPKGSSKVRTMRGAR